MANGTAVRCHFAEEIDPSQWVPTEDIAPAITSQQANGQEENLLEVQNLKKYYEVKGSSLKDIMGLSEPRYVKAVENASFAVKKGKTLGVVGESGCGKSTLIKTLIGLEDSIV